MIFKIFKKDLKGLSRNILALAIALGLCLIPSLYSWFNIYSNWDPYANTASVQIAIVSEDEGYSESDDSTINMGEQIVEQLHSNDKLGWRFPETKDEAMNKLNAGKYYAVIVVGEDFSRSLYDFLDNGLNPPTVTYYENSKKNAVASKITDTGKSTLQNTINSEFIDVCVKTIMQGLNEIAENDPSIIEKTVKDLQSVSANINSYDTMIDMFIKSNSDLADNLAKLQEILPQIKDVLTGTTDVADIANKSLDNVTDDIANQIDAQLKAMNELTDSALDSLDKAVQLSITDIGQAGVELSKANKQLKELIDQNKALEDAIDSLSKVDGIDPAVITALKSALASVNAMENIAYNLVQQCADILTDSPETLQAKYQLIKSVVEQCRTELQKSQTIMQTVIRTNVNLLKASIKNAVSSLAANISSAGDSINGISQMLLGVSDISVNINTTLESTKTLLDSLNKRLDTISGSVGDISSSSTYKLIMDFINSDAQSIASFLSEPVQVEEIYVYMQTNYGTSVTPFYTTLALWVGGIVLVALMKVKVDYEDDEFKDATEHQKYMGRALLFLAMGQLQALVVVLGDLYILKIDCTHPFMLWLAAAITSFVFTLFIYTLVLTFGDLGKAIAVVMIVLQIAGSGGTYPIELLPEFFQNVYLYFPFPYAINAMREAISGLYQCDYAVFLVKLCAYAVISLILGLGIRKSLLEVREFFERRMKETHFM